MDRGSIWWEWRTMSTILVLVFWPELSVCPMYPLCWSSQLLSSSWCILFDRCILLRIRTASLGLFFLYFFGLLTLFFMRSKASPLFMSQGFTDLLSFASALFKSMFKFGTDVFLAANFLGLSWWLFYRLFDWAERDLSHLWVPVTVMSNELGAIKSLILGSSIN